MMTHSNQKAVCTSVFASFAFGTGAEHVSFNCNLLNPEDTQVEAAKKQRTEGEMLDGDGKPPAV